MLINILLMLMFLFVWSLPRLDEEAVTLLYANRGPQEATNVLTSDERYRLSGLRETNLFVSSHGVV